jgi:hypothetical protein
MVAATVHDDHLHADRVQQDDVLGEGGEVLAHGVAAVLDDHDAAGEPPDVGQGLDEDRGLVGAHDVPMFSSM